MTSENTVNQSESLTHEDELLSIAQGNDIAEAANEEYRELIELFGLDVALGLYKHYRGCRIDCPKNFFNTDFLIKVAAEKENKREREKIAVTCGLTSEWLEARVRKYLREKTRQER
jgi:hypothetical protein